MAGRYIRVVHEEDGAFLTADIGLIVLDLVFSARLSVLPDHDELGALELPLTPAELKTRALPLWRKRRRAVASAAWPRP